VFVIIGRQDHDVWFFVFFQIDFLRYSQQWKKKAVFVLNKADIYQNNQEVCVVFLFVLIIGILISMSSFVVKLLN